MCSKILTRRGIGICGNGREDWISTSLARYGMPAPKFAMYIAPGPSDKKVMAQTSGELDVIHDIAPEGMITLARTNPTSKGWFPSFPWAHPDPTLPSVIYNNEKPGLNSRDVRWALTLAIRHRACGDGLLPAGPATILGDPCPPDRPLPRLCS
jgi:peptide/nickel transport system substrate-binding protein